MDTAPLSLFALKVSASNRLLSADLRRLRRDVLPGGITTREEAEVLLRLDRIERLDAEWTAYLAEAVAKFVISASGPDGIDHDISAWLAVLLSAAQPRTAAAIVRVIQRESHQVDEDLAAFTRRPAKRAIRAPEGGIPVARAL